MPYPKKHKFAFVQLENKNCIQVNYHESKKIGYWWIEPAPKPIKLPIGEIPAALKGVKIEWSEWILNKKQK